MQPKQSPHQPGTPLSQSTCVSRSLYVLVCACGLAAAQLAVGAERVDYYVPNSVRIDVEASGGGSAAWQLVSERDTDGRWIVDDAFWRPASYTETNVPPGCYGVVFRAAPGWSPPAEMRLELTGGEEFSRTVSLAKVPEYVVGEIPPLSVRHGETLRFAIESFDANLEFEPHPDVERDITFDGRVFAYTPSPAERVAFTVTLTLSSGVEQTIAVAPTAETQPEQTILQYRGDLVDAEAKTYLKVIEEDLGEENFNYRTRNVRRVVISGPTVVFEAGHENDLYTLYADGVDDIKEMEIYADTVVFRSPTRLQGTTVSIFARQLRFEDLGEEPASLSTVPAEISTTSNSDGAHGLPAGDVTLNVASMVAPGSDPRLILRGGEGQDPHPGADGGSWPSLSWYSEPDGHSNGWPTSGVVTYVKQKSTCGPLDSRTDDWGTTACPKNGKNAVAAKVPGDGGAAGRLSVPFGVDSSIVDIRGGNPGKDGPDRFGGRAQGPSKVHHVYRVCALKYEFPISCRGISSCDNWSITKTCPTPKDGVDQPGTFGSPGVDGIVEGTTAIDGWLQPVTIRTLLQYAKDVYLNGHVDAVATILAPYDTALAKVATDGESSMELVQLAQEVNTLRHRAAGHLDYFGNPAGWVPMLSFEVTRDLFEDEVQAAGNLLYLTYYLGGEIEGVTNKQAALSRLRAELWEEIAAFESELEERRYEIEDLADEAEAIDSEIRDLGRDLKARAENLREQAKRNAALKKSLRVTGTVLTSMPIGQPALGLTGIGLTSASKFNEEDPIDSAINGTNAAHEFLMAQMHQDMEDFQTVSGAGDPRLGAAMLARQKSIQSLDAGVVGVNQVLREAKSWDSDVDAEVSLLMSEDPRSKQLVGAIRELNVRKQRFVERMAAAVQRAKFLMTSINQDYLALDSLQRDLVAVTEKIDQEAFSYIKEIERRAKDRLLKYQYYLAKAFEYRTVRPYVGSFQLGRIYDFFADNFTNTISEVPGEAILDPASLIAVYDEELRTITDAIVDDLAQRPQEQTLPIFYTLSQEELAQLNTPPYSVNLNLVEVGAVFSRTQENLRISELKVESVAAAPRSGANRANLSILLQHSGVSLISSEGDTYKFHHYNTLETPPITWEAQFSPFTGDLTNTEPSEASRSLLKSLIGDTDDLLLYSRPSAWADLLVTKETLSDSVDMVVNELTLRVSVDFARKSSGQSDLEVKPVNAAGETLAARVALGAADQNRRQDGRGIFTRVFRAGERVELEASASYGSQVFDRWESRSGELLGTEPRLSVTLPTSPNGSATTAKVRAVYAPGELVPGGGDTPFRRGDANTDGGVDMSDAIAILNRLFVGGSELPCEDASDTNDDGRVDISDPMNLLLHLFVSGSAPPAPHDACGEDPTDDGLDCDAFAPCS